MVSGKRAAELGYGWSSKLYERRGQGVGAYSKPEEASCAKEKMAGGIAEVGEVRGLEEGQ